MVKVISLSEEAYQNLRRIKGPKESFSKVVIKLTKEKKKDITKFFGIWKGDKEMKDAFERVAEERKKFRLRTVEF